MSKNKYRLPFDDVWYIEFGGVTKRTSHSWDIISQRYAYDFEIRKNGKPYHDDYHDNNNFYSYKKEILCTCDGVVVDLVNEYDDTRIVDDRKTICDSRDIRGNYILIKHPNNEYSLTCHILKNSFRVNVGDFVREGEVLALVGNSGNTEGAHIHFQIQNGYDFNKAGGIPIRFKNVKIVNKCVKRRYLICGMYVKNVPKIK